MKYEKGADGKMKVVKYIQKRESKIFDGRKYLLETAIKGDVGILRAYKVDEAGNCVFRRATKAFGSLVARASHITIVEGENIVPVGEIDPDDVDLPGIYVDRVVPATAQKHIEIMKLRKTSSSSTNQSPDESASSLAAQRRERIARRAAKELKHGYFANLGKPAT